MSRQIGSKRRQQYSPEILEHAADLVRASTISLSQAAKKYAVPKSTLQNTVHNKYSGHKVGHKTILTEHEEKRIADWAIHMARIGYGRTRQELANTVKKILDDDGRKTPFRDNRPGREWLNRFFIRHPDLSVRTTIQLGKERAIISPEKIEKWFADFKSYFEEEVRDKELLKDPTRIYNADESGISLCTKSNQVIGFKGAPVVYHYGNSDKTQLTIMAACSASAHFVPPMIIFPGQRFSYNPLEGFEEAALGRSDNGWMDSEVFCNWLENVFIPSVNARNVRKPVLLLIDGHVTHVTMKASDICLQNGIEMYCLLEHASHVLQPLDLRLFSALKKSWRQAVRDWQSEHIGEYVTKATFARVFKTAWLQSTTVDVAVKGFKEAGLFPLDPTVVVNSVKIEPSKIFDSPATASVSIPIKQADASGAAEIKHDAEDEKESSKLSETDEGRHGVFTVNKEMSQNSTAIADENTTDDHSGTSTEPMAVLNVNQNNTASSPFSKHLAIPTPKVPSKPKAAKRIAIPKAITGSAYRQLMEEKRAKKEEEEREKERKKQERLEKRKTKEEEKMKRKVEMDAKRQKRAQEKKRKQELRERLLRSLDDSDSGSDDAISVERENCYACEQPYSTDYIECVACFRRFHIDCVNDDYMQIEGLPFECKFC